MTVKNHKTGEVCGMFGREGICIQGFGKERDHLEDLSLDGKMILKWFLNKLFGNSCKGEVEGFCERGYEPFCCLNSGGSD